MNHPSNKLQRKVVELKKYDANEKKHKKDRTSKVRRKLTIESLQEKEADHELRTYNRAGSLEVPA